MDFSFATTNENLNQSMYSIVSESPREGIRMLSIMQVGTLSVCIQLTHSFSLLYDSPLIDSFRSHTIAPKPVVIKFYTSQILKPHFSSINNFNLNNEHARGALPRPLPCLFRYASEILITTVEYDCRFMKKTI